MFGFARELSTEYEVPGTQSIQYYGISFPASPVVCNVTRRLGELGSSFEAIEDGDWDRGRGRVTCMCF